MPRGFGKRNLEDLNYYVRFKGVKVSHENGLNRFAEGYFY